MTTKLPLMKCSEDDIYIPQLLERIQSYHLDTEDSFVRLSHITMNPTLDPYHLRTVRWMVNKENKDYSIENDGSQFTGGILADVLNEDKRLEIISCIVANPPPQIFYQQKVLLDCRSKELRSNFPIPLYSKCIISKLNKTLYVPTKFNASTYDRSHTIIESLSKKLNTSKGNFESGLNINCYCKKRLSKSSLMKCEMCGEAQHTCCVEYNPKTAGGLAYLCYNCWELNDPIQCRATLIIVPDLCLELWNQKIQSTVNGVLKCFIYNGVQSCNFIQPTIFNDFDVVLTTYSKIEKDLKYGKHNVNKDHTIYLRHVKKYYHPQSPLLCINWWRICLDQPQSFNSDIDKVFKIVSCLKTAHKWVMPGISIQDSSKNLFSILKYLNVCPDKSHDYNNFIQFMKNETEDKFIWFSKLIWCNLIKHINAELSLPKPIYNTHYLSFSKFEKYFYKITENNYSLDARSAYIKNRENESLKKKLLDLDLETKLSVVKHISKLLEACVVPLINNNILNINGIFSLKYTIRNKIKICRAECNELLHQLISNLKKIAELSWFVPNSDSLNAELHFLMILSLIDNHHQQRKLTAGTDYEIIELFHKSMQYFKENPSLKIGYTTSYMENTIQNLESSILNFYRNNILHDRQMLQHKLAKTNNTTEINSLSYNDWWMNMSQCILSPTDFLTEVKTTIDRNCKAGRLNIMNRLKSMDEVNFILTKWLTDIVQCRNNVLTTYKTLDEKSNGFNIGSQFVCTGRNEKECLTCTFSKQLRDYKLLLFNTNFEITNDNIIQHLTKENQNQLIISQYEIVLRSLILCKTSNSCVADIYLKQAIKHLELLNMLGSELLNLWKLWFSLDDYMKAHYKIIKAKSKLTIDDLLVHIEKPRGSTKKKKKMDDAEINNLLYQRLQNFKTKIPGCLSRFQVKHECLVYLEKFKFRKRKSQLDKCNACDSGIDEYALLYCGHGVCSSCFIQEYERSDSINLNCSACGRSHPVKYMERNRVYKEPSVTLNGSFCIKLEGIICELKKVISLDRCSKIIIFSSFEKSLDCLSLALSLNSIHFMRLHLGTKDITSALNTFQNSENMTTILINLNTGLNNLVFNFATRIFFMDPVIDKSFENQIVDQIFSKQIKQTYVHHFIIKDSIEEKLSNIFTDEDLLLGINVTLGQLSDCLINETNSPPD